MKLYGAKDKETAGEMDVEQAKDKQDQVHVDTIVC